MTDEIIQKLDPIAKRFGIKEKLVSVKKVGNGHINATYDVITESGMRYVFQKLNVYVFKNPKRVMQNIERITAHIADKLESEGLDRNRVMHFLYTTKGKNYFVEGQGFWRISEYVPDTVTYNTCDDLDKLRSAGKAFGEFQTFLSDFDASLLHETIPNFHNTRSRIAVFMRHVNDDPCGRADEVVEEIEKVKKYTKLATKLNELLDADKLPVRVIHNDTKINNVLFDKNTGEAKTVIDLDTVMTGLLAHDFGDAIRFAGNTAAEDEKDLSKVSLNLDCVRAFAEGFIPAVSATITRTEIETLALGAFTLTFEQAVRFLDDYLTGDQYFRTEYTEHNLVRARCQFKLAEEMYSHLDDMNQIVFEVAGKKF